MTTIINSLELINVTKTIHSILTTTHNLITQDDIDVQAIFSNELNRIENIEEVLQQDPTYLERKNTLKRLKLEIEREVQNLFPKEVNEQNAQINPFLEVEKDTLSAPSQQLYRRIAQEFDNLDKRAKSLSQKGYDVLAKAVNRGLNPDFEELLQTILEQQNIKNASTASGQTNLAFTEALSNNINGLHDYLFLTQLLDKVQTFKKQFDCLHKKMHQDTLAHQINRFLKNENNDLYVPENQQPATFIFHANDCRYEANDVFTKEELRVRTLLLEKPPLYEKLKENFWVKSRVRLNRKAPTYIDIHKASELTLGQCYYIDNRENMSQISLNIQSMYEKLATFSKAVSPILDVEINTLQKTRNKEMIARLTAIQTTLSKEALKQPLKAIRDYTEKWNQYESFYKSKHNDHSFIGTIKRLFHKLFPSAEIKAHRMLSDQLRRQKDSMPTKEPVKAIYGFFSSKLVNIGIDTAMMNDMTASATAAQEPPKQK